MKEENKINPTLALKLKKLREKAEKKIANTNKKNNSMEIEKSRELGKKHGMQYQEIEECYKIAEEFKINPPILYSTHINGITTEQKYDAKFAKKVEMLKKNHFSFLTAVHHSSTFGITFKVFGKAYIKRGLQKIPLIGTKEEQTLILKDKDILGTQENSYIYEIRDSIPNNSEKQSTDIIIYPKSEMKFYIDEKTTHPKPAFMIPEKVSETIKKNSKSTVNQQTIKNIELLNGIFFINLIRRKQNVNNLLRINSSYPKFSFKHISNIYTGIIKDTITKFEKQGSKLNDAIKNKILNKTKKESNVCDEISAIIELCKDKSIVITRALNSIFNEEIKKETKKIIGNIGKPIKITLTRNQLYETDTSVHPDERIFILSKIPMGLSLYLNSIKGKEEIKEILKQKDNYDSKKDAKTMISDAEEMLKNAKELNDNELIEIAKIRLETTNKFVKGKIQEISEMEKENLLKTLKIYEKQIEEMKPILENRFPPYSAPNASDVI